MKPPAQKQIETCPLRMRGLSSSARNMNIVGQSPWKGLSPLQGRNVCRLATIVDAAAVMAQLINRDTCVGVCVCVGIFWWVLLGKRIWLCLLLFHCWQTWTTKFCILAVWWRFDTSATALTIITANKSLTKGSYITFAALDCIERIRNVTSTVR